MSEVKNEGLEVVAFEVSFPLGIGRKVYEQEQAWANHNYGSGIVYHVEPLCRHSEALAGYAVRDARIAELEAESAEWSPVMQRLGDENQQLRAELAAAKETIMRYEVTAENCDLLRAELAAIKGQVPVAWEVYYSDDDSFHTITRDKALIECYSKMAYTIKPLYAAPVAKQVVMPARMEVPGPLWSDTRQPYGRPLNLVDITEAKMFNMALDEVTRLNAADHTEGGV